MCLVLLHLAIVKEKPSDMWLLHFCSQYPGEKLTKDSDCNSEAGKCSSAVCRGRYLTDEETTLNMTNQLVKISWSQLSEKARTAARFDNHVSPALAHATTLPGHSPTASL